MTNMSGFVSNRHIQMIQYNLSRFRLNILLVGDQTTESKMGVWGDDGAVLLGWLSFPNS